MKIAVIADLHLGKRALIKDGRIRSASNKVSGAVPTYIKTVLSHQPDLVIDLGDLIRSDDAKIDLTNYKKAFSFVRDLGIPTIHMIGNHEVKKLPLDSITSHWLKNDYKYDHFGSMSFGNTEILWISFETELIDGGIEAKLPDNQFTWLKAKVTESKKQIYVFTHYPLTGDDFSGNFLFDGIYKRFGHYNNGDKVVKMLSKYENVKAVFSGHSHWINFVKYNQLPLITLPSATENIAAPEAKNNFPGVFTIIDVDKKQTTVKCYSGDYCFCSLTI